MSETPREGVAVIWHDLPDPGDPAAPKGEKISLVVPVRAWRHIIEKHIRCTAEPWDCLLTEGIRQILIGEPLDTVHQSEAGRQALAKLEAEIRHSLERPLVMLYAVRQAEDSGEPGKIRYRVWGMVLPSGATAYAHQTDATVELMTCYFPAICCVRTVRGQRWKKTVRTLLLRYCPRSSDKRTLYYPSEEHQALVRPEGEKPEYRCRIRFVTWQTWGFLSGEPGSPWRGQLKDWPVAAPSAEQNRKPRRLRPWEQEESLNL